MPQPPLEDAGFGVGGGLLPSMILAEGDAAVRVDNEEEGGGGGGWIRKKRQVNLIQQFC